MYQVQNQEVADFIMSDSRCFRFLMAFENGTTISEDIGNITIQANTPEDILQVGAVVSKSFSAKVLGLTSSVEGQKVLLYIYAVNFEDAYRIKYSDLEKYTYAELSAMTVSEIGALSSFPYELIPMGKFKVSSCISQGEEWSIEANDLLYNIDDEYVSGLTYPAYFDVVESEICNLLGIDGREPIDPSRYRPQLSFKPTGYSYRDVLSFCASLDEGCCVMIGRTGELIHREYADIDYSISEDRADVPQIAQREIEFSQLTCLREGRTTPQFDAVAQPNNKRIMTFSNPFMSQTIFGRIANNFLGFSYTPIDIYHRLADPRLDLFDIVSVTSENGDVYKVPLMSMSMTFDGGFFGNIASLGKSERDEEAGRATGPITKQYQESLRKSEESLQEQLQKAVEDAEAAFQEQMQEAVDYINGANGGYVVTKVNADGQPTEMYFTDNLDIEQASNIIRINRNGIAGTNAGYTGAYKTAITNDGRINASQILTGTLSAIALQSTNYDADAKTGSRINLANGQFWLAGGALKYLNGVLSYVGNAEITGGSFNVETTNQNSSAIKLHHNEWSIELSPLEWVLTNSSTGFKIKAQAGGIFGYQNGTETFVIVSDGRIILREGGGIILEDGDIYMTNGYVLAKDVSVNVNGRTVSLADYIASHP